MESFASLLKGGKNGASVVPGDLAASELYRRITLDPSHEDFMPAEDKTPLTQTEKDIIRLWIEEGPIGKGTKIPDLKESKEMMRLASSLFGLPASSDPDFNLTGQNSNTNIPDSINMALVEDLREMGLVVRLMLQKPAMLDITLPPRSGKRISEIDDALKRVAAHVIWLNLSDNKLIDSDLDILQHMSNLKKLRIEKNPVSDSIAYFLEKLKYLEAVNLNETRITPMCVARLQKNPAIRRIYTWKTQCDDIKFDR